jgi:hypothetical protein
MLSRDQQVSLGQAWLASVTGAQDRDAQRIDALASLCDPYRP